MQTTTSTLDARGLNCPLPILRTRKALASLDSGETLKIIATDPGAVKDIDSFCNQTGHSLIASNDEQGEYIFIVQKS
ncbi:MAG TPA: sulfurtransferase TusA family protein [Chromatiales bacterium]|nr:sulfurtransferase TusA family protein [Thiotrichales bacterium]HIP69664.1 sulfurtransferase TusA family protein [Chromatiales bacterium]